MFAGDLKALAKSNNPTLQSADAWTDRAAHTWWSDDRLVELSIDHPCTATGEVYDTFVAMIGHQDATVRGDYLVEIMASLAANTQTSQGEPVFASSATWFSKDPRPVPAWTAQTLRPWSGTTTTKSSWLGGIQKLEASSSREIAARYISYLCLAYFRAALKSVQVIQNLHTSVNRTFTSLYGIPVNLESPFTDALVQAMVAAFAEKPPLVMGILVAAAEAAILSPSKAAKSIVSAALTTSMTFHAMPVISIARRGLMAIKRSAAEVYSQVYGVGLDESFAALLSAQVVYKAPKETHDDWVAKGQLVNSPGTGQKFWMFARALDETCMSGLGGDQHDSFLAFFIALHDMVNVDNQIKPGYRQLKTTMDSARITLLAETVRQHFGGFGEDDDVGALVKTARQQAKTHSTHGVVELGARKRVKNDEPEAETEGGEFDF